MSSGNNHWHGLITPNVRIEVDEASIFDPGRTEAKPGTVIRHGTQLIAKAKSLTASRDLDPIILEDGRTDTSEEHAGFFSMAGCGWVLQ